MHKNPILLIVTIIDILNVTKPIEMIGVQRTFGLIRHKFPNYKSLFDPKCKVIFLDVFTWLLNTQIKFYVTT